MLQEAGDEIVLLVVDRVGQYAPEIHKLVEPAPDILGGEVVVGEYLRLQPEGMARRPARVVACVPEADVEEARRLTFESFSSLQNSGLITLLLAMCHLRIEPNEPL